MKLKIGAEIKFGRENPKIQVSKIENPWMKVKKKKKKKNDKLSEEAENWHLY